MSAGDVVIRPMVESDLEKATHVFRLAFGTFFQLPDPLSFAGTIDMIATRWTTDPGTAFVAESEGRVIGSVIGSHWGSQFVIGPLTVDPAFWRAGVARRLMTRIMDVSAERGARLTVLYTHPQSAMHIRLYESFGLLPFALTSVLGKSAGKASARTAFRRFSALSKAKQASALAQMRAVTDAIYRGLDLTREVEAAAGRHLGDAVLIEDAVGLAGFALCHCGAGTEAGDGTLYVKFAAVRPGAAPDFERLLDAIEQLAGERGAERIVAGVNTSRRDAYHRMLARGFRAGTIGVAMQHPDEPGTLRRDAYVIDDWR